MKSIRQQLGQAKRVVVKVGTRVLVDRRGRPDRSRLVWLVKQLAAAKRQGVEVVLVSSGAIGAGIEALGWSKRPKELVQLQMAAAVGQSRLMAQYSDLFAYEDTVIGQVLLTHDDLKHRQRHLNARNALLALLRNGAVPIVNENDAVAIDEIKFGDNDQLAALVAILIGADALVLLSTVNGFRLADKRTGRTKRVPHLTSVGQPELDAAWSKGSALSSGGMQSKLTAAQRFVDVGGLAVIADGRKQDTLHRVLAGDDVGTVIGQGQTRALSSRKQWIAFFHRARGTVIIDRGAARALERQGKSLLPAGICGVEGTFEVGALVNIRTQEGRNVGRGLTNYDSSDLARIQGKRSREIAGLGGDCSYEEAIHRDNLVVKLQGDSA